MTKRDHPANPTKAVLKTIIRRNFCCKCLFTIPGYDFFFFCVLFSPSIYLACNFSPSFHWYDIIIILVTGTARVELYGAYRWQVAHSI